MPSSPQTGALVVISAERGRCRLNPVWSYFHFPFVLVPACVIRRPGRTTSVPKELALFKQNSRAVPDGCLFSRRENKLWMKGAWRQGIWFPSVSLSGDLEPPFPLQAPGFSSAEQGAVLYCFRAGALDEVLAEHLLCAAQRCELVHHSLWCWRQRGLNPR